MQIRNVDESGGGRINLLVEGGGSGGGGEGGRAVGGVLDVTLSYTIFMLDITHDNAEDNLVDDEDEENGPSSEASPPQVIQFLDNISCCFKESCLLRGPATTPNHTTAHHTTPHHAKLGFFNTFNNFFPLLS